ncbi:RNA polymerase sigma factor (sigma-70 family) [Microbacteriaceae bacterium SG_E_30_P1]|uniref:RNA polymerase sigma factor (Sigma-70 family) n=1 Tax=Antiquaquibacter oligotrophicus TaxID=2880260 RepID=A0ABT6KNS1_9MICO|nr:RNA polymerase sigma factor [Antiquaquibacter oligotrophicus]MDH6181519.1 RNA polymerase sigma factor (sigma-70 family) [Antiquaquibacter oligotrophicus]UDF12791.1 RNA polymerase sigma factor [Antiquaquibacter oligotrophicus]
MSRETPSSEALWWRRALSGDGDAFARLFDTHRDRLFRSALARTASPTDAEDAVAAAFLELWRKRRSVRLVDGSVLPWLLTTTHNVVRNLARYQRRHRAFLERLPPPGTEPSAETIAQERSEHHDRSQHLAAILDALPPADAEIIALVLVEELSLAHTADVLGITTDAARQRLSRARRRARGIHPTLPTVLFESERHPS